LPVLETLTELLASGLTPPKPRQTFICRLGRGQGWRRTAVAITVAD
jgi:hypothetical protein